MGTSTAFQDLHLTNLVVDGYLAANVRIVSEEGVFGIMSANEIKAQRVSAIVGDFGNVDANVINTSSIIINTQNEQPVTVDNIVINAGPSTNDAAARWDGTDGQHIQNSSMIVDDLGNISFLPTGTIATNGGAISTGGGNLNLGPTGDLTVNTLFFNSLVPPIPTAVYGGAVSQIFQMPYIADTTTTKLEPSAITFSGPLLNNIDTQGGNVLTNGGDVDLRIGAVPTGDLYVDVLNYVSVVPPFPGGVVSGNVPSSFPPAQDIPQITNGTTSAIAPSGLKLLSGTTMSTQNMNLVTSTGDITSNVTTGGTFNLTPSVGTGELRFQEASPGTDYVGFKSADPLVSGNVVWTLPPFDGNSMQVLVTAGLPTSQLSWAPPPIADFPDNLFRVFDDVDITKKLAFEVSNVNTATTRTFATPNFSSSLPATPPGTNLLLGILAAAGLSGTDNTILGPTNGSTITSSNFNVNLSGSALNIVTTGDQSVFMGFKAGVNRAAGIATATTANTLTDSTQNMIVNEWVGRVLTIVSGTGAPQSKTVTSNTATQFTVAPNFAPAIAVASGYYIEDTAAAYTGTGATSVGSYSRLPLASIDAVSVGYNTGRNTGLQRTAIGAYAGSNDTDDCTYVGFRCGALAGSANGDNNTLAGSSIGYSTTNGTFTAVNAPRTIITDALKTFLVDQWVGDTIVVTAGPGAPQSRTISANTATTVTVSVAFNPGVGVGSVYTIRHISSITKSTLISNYGIGDYTNTVAVGYNSSFLGVTNGVTLGSHAAEGVGAATSTSNVVVGYNANRSYNASNTQSIIIGSAAGENLGGAFSAVLIGYNSAQNSTDVAITRAIALGAHTLENTTTNSDSNVVAGWSAGFNLSTGTGNTFVGYGAGMEATLPVVTTGITTGLNSICIGYMAGSFSVGIPAGQVNNTIAIGAHASASQNTFAGTTVTVGTIAIGSTRVGVTPLSDPNDAVTTIANGQAAFGVVDTDDPTVAIDNVFIGTGAESEVYTCTGGTATSIIDTTKIFGVNTAPASSHAYNTCRIMLLSGPLAGVIRTVNSAINNTSTQIFVSPGWGGTPAAGTLYSILVGPVQINTTAVTGGNSNGDGQNLIFAGGRGTGVGTVGKVVFDTANFTGVSTDVQTRSTRFTLDEGFAYFSETRVLQNLGAVSGSGTSTITINNNGNLYIVSASGPLSFINLISLGAIPIQDGTQITLRMTGAGTVIHNSGGNFRNNCILLAGSVNFAVSTGDVLGLVLTTRDDSFGGTATSGTATTIVDGTAPFAVSQYVNWTVTITAGPGAGQSRTVASNTTTTLTISGTFSPIAGVGSVYLLTNRVWQETSRKTI